MKNYLKNCHSNKLLRNNIIYYSISSLKNKYFFHIYMLTRDLLALEGFKVGDFVGSFDGLLVGLLVGSCEGLDDGFCDGTKVG